MNRTLPHLSKSLSFQGTQTFLPRNQFTQRHSSDVVVRSTKKGRSGVSGVIATVFGATGFLGHALVNSLAQNGSQIVIPFRGQQNSYKRLKVSGDLGQLVPAKYEIRDYESVLRAISESKVVINCIGRWSNTSNFTTKDANVSTAAVVAKACAEMGVEKLVHVSAFGASENSPSEFARLKWESEQEVRKYLPEASIFRPTTFYGIEDRFFSRNALIVLKGKEKAVIKVLHPLNTEMSPLHVSDAVDGILHIISSPESQGENYHLVGPDDLTYSKLIKIMEETSFTLPQEYFVLSDSWMRSQFESKISFKISKNPDWTPMEVEYTNNVSPKLKSTDSYDLKPLLGKPLIGFYESSDAIMKPLRDNVYWNFGENDQYSFELDSYNLR